MVKLAFDPLTRIPANIPKSRSVLGFPFADGTDERLGGGSRGVLRLDARRILVQASSSRVRTMRAAIWKSVHIHGGREMASRGIMNSLALLYRRERSWVMERRSLH